MQWNHYTLLIILGLLLSSVSLILNIYKYKETTKSRDGMLAELTELKNMTSQYLEVLEWTTSDLRSRVKQLEKYNKKLLEKIISLTLDENFPELKPHPVKTIGMRQRNSQWWSNRPLSPLLLRIPAEDANLVLFNSPEPQFPPSPSIITRINFIRKDQIPWQEKFRLVFAVLKIPFFNWAVVISNGPNKIRFCADAFLLLASVLPAPILPFDIVIDKERKEEILSSGIAPDYVEIGIDISDGPRLPRNSVKFLDAIIKLYPHIEGAYRSKDEIHREMQLFMEYKGESGESGGPAVEASMKIELETYKKAILRLRNEAGWYENIPSPESLQHVGIEHYYICSAHVRLKSIDNSGYAIFTVEG